MRATISTTGAVRWSRIGLGSCLLLAISLAAAYSQRFDKMVPYKEKKDYQKAPSAQVKTARAPVEAGAVEVVFTDGSNLKMLLREEKIALDTPYGKLLIAVADIQRVEFATRVSEEDAKRIHAAIIDLGSSEFSKREAASAELLKLREKGYPELLRAIKQKDLEVVRRARELIQQIIVSVPAERLTVRPKDVVYTADSMIAGRIEGVWLKAHTSQFGSVKLRLADARALRSQALESQANALYPQPAWSGSSPPLPMGGRPGGFQGMMPKGKGMMPKERGKPLPK